MKRTVLVIVMAAVLCAVPLCSIGADGSDAEPPATSGDSGASPAESIQTVIGSVLPAATVLLSSFSIPEGDEDDYEVWEGEKSVDKDITLTKNVVVKDGAKITFSNGSKIIVPAGTSLIINGSVDLVCGGSDVSFLVESSEGSIAVGNMPFISGENVTLTSSASVKLDVRMDSRMADADGNPVFDLDAALSLDIYDGDEEDAVVIKIGDGEMKVDNNVSGSEIDVSVDADLTSLARFIDGLGEESLAEIVALIIAKIGDGSLLDPAVRISAELYALNITTLENGDRVVTGETVVKNFGFLLASDSSGLKLSAHADGLSRSDTKEYFDPETPTILDYAENSMDIEGLVLEIGVVGTGVKADLVMDSYVQSERNTKAVTNISGKIGGESTVSSTTIDDLDVGLFVTSDNIGSDIENIIALIGAISGGESLDDGFAIGAKIGADVSVGEIVYKDNELRGTAPVTAVTDKDAVCAALKLIEDRDETATISECDGETYAVSSLVLDLDLSVTGTSSVVFSVGKISVLTTSLIEETGSDTSTAYDVTGISLKASVPSVPVKEIMDMVSVIKDEGDVGSSMLALFGALAEGDGASIEMSIGSIEASSLGEAVTSEGTLSGLSLTAAVSFSTVAVSGTVGDARITNTCDDEEQTLLELDGVSVDVEISVTGFENTVVAFLKFVGGEPSAEGLKEFLNSIDMSIVVDADISVKTFVLAPNEALSVNIGDLSVTVDGNVVRNTKVSVDLGLFEFISGENKAVVKNLSMDVDSDYGNIFGLIVAVAAYDPDEEGELNDIVGDIINSDTKTVMKMEFDLISFENGAVNMTIGSDVLSKADAPKAVRLSVTIQSQKTSVISVDLGIGLSLTMEDRAEIRAESGDFSFRGKNIDADIALSADKVNLLELLFSKDASAVLLDKFDVSATLSADILQLSDINSSNVGTIIDVRNVGVSVKVPLSALSDSEGDLSVFELSGSMTGFGYIRGTFDDDRELDYGEEHTFLKLGKTTFSSVGAKIVVDCESATVDIRDDGGNVVTSRIDDGNDHLAYRMAVDDGALVCETIGSDTTVDGTIVINVTGICEISSGSEMLAGQSFPAGSCLSVKCDGTVPEGQMFIGWNISGTEYFDGETAFLPAGPVTITQMMSGKAVVPAGSTTVTSATDDVAVSSEDLGMMKDNAGTGAVTVELASGTISFGNGAIGKIIPSGDGNVAFRMTVGSTLSYIDSLDSDTRSKLANAVFVSVNLVNASSTSGLDGTDVTIPYTLRSGETADMIAVYYIDGDGAFERMDATYSEKDGKGYVTFTTDHFSDFAVFAEKSPSSSPSDDDDNVLVIAVAVVGVLAVLGLAVLMYRRKAA